MLSSQSIIRYLCLSFLVSIHNNGQYISSCINNLYSYGYVFVHVLLATFVETDVSKSVIEIVLNIPVTVLRNIIIPVWWGSTNHHSPKHWRGIRICLDDALVLMLVANCVDDTNLYYSRWTGINMWDILHHHWHIQCQPLTQCLLIWKKKV